VSAASVEAVVPNPQCVGRGREQSRPLLDPFRADRVKVPKSHLVLVDLGYDRTDSVKHRA
jgi:hypothetical protein